MRELKDHYEKLFDPIKLVKYGYYDISFDKNDYKKKYGSSEAVYSKIFNMNSFTKLMKKKNLDDFFDLRNPGKNKSTEPIFFSIPKGQNSRRQYKMPNLYSYMALNYYMHKHQDEFIGIFVENKMSTSKFFNKINFEKTQEIRQNLLYGGGKRLHLDLSNFYHTLYTHSIPWIVVGKENAKKDRRKGFANQLDKFVTLCQYDETHGIPTGNLLSKLIAEFYMCHFDKRMEDKNLVYSRYVDDFTFAYTFEYEKENFLKEFYHLCRENNLIINDSKTKINNFPFKDELNKNELFAYFENINSKDSTEKWISKIKNFLDYCVHQESLGNKGSIKAIFPVIKNQIEHKGLKKEKINKIFSTKLKDSNFNLFEKILDLSLKDSTLTNKFLVFFEKINKQGFSTNNASKIVKNYFKANKKKYISKINFYTKNHYNQELYQLLLYFVIFGVYDILNSEKLMKSINKNIDDFSLILIVILLLKKNKSDVKKILNCVDELFIESHSMYEDENNRMSEKFWMFRYFIYFLIQEEKISKSDFKAYCRSQSYTSNSKGYQTELNWKYVRKSGNKIDDFFSELLKNKVSFVDLGKNSDFKYFI